MRCEDCKYFYSYGTNQKGAVGECRRYPPKISLMHGNQYIEVEGDNWCGEFQHIKEHAVDSVRRQLAEDTTHTPFE